MAVIEMTVVLVDHLATRRAAYSALIEGWTEPNGFALVAKGEAGGADAAERTAALTLVVLGSDLVSSEEGRKRLAVVAQTCDGPVVAIVETQSPDCVAAAFDLRLMGILRVSEAPSVIFAALAFIVAGGCYIPHVQTARVAPSEVSFLPKPVKPDAPPLAAPHEAEDAALEGPSLTRRQQEVLFGLVNGASNKEIARSLKLSEATVKTHVRQVMRKLNAGNRTQAALFARNLSSAAMVSNAFA